SDHYICRGQAKRIRHGRSARHLAVIELLLMAIQTEAKIFTRLCSVGATRESIAHNARHMHGKALATLAGACHYLACRLARQGRAWRHSGWFQPWCGIQTHNPTPRKGLPCRLPGHDLLTWREYQLP